MKPETTKYDLFWKGWAAGFVEGPAMEAEIVRLRTIEEHAGLMRDAIEGLSVGHAQRADTIRGALRLVASAYDEGVA